MNSHKILGILSAFLVPLWGCVQIPETGKSALILTSPEYENQLGEQGYKEVLAKSKINPDPKLNEILRRTATQISRQTGKRDFKWEFNLIESKEQNAWCMPGGKIAVYTGILPAMASEGGMAVVLGHEVAHATLRHAGKRITSEMFINLGLSFAEVSLGNIKYKNTLMGLLGAGAAVGIILPFSRGDESEADQYGLRYMARAGYDPREAVLFWQRFAKSAGGSPPQFLSTHPGTLTRIRDLQNQMPQALQWYENSPQKFGSGEVLSAIRH